MSSSVGCATPLKTHEAAMLLIVKVGVAVMAPLVITALSGTVTVITSLLLMAGLYLMLVLQPQSQLRCEQMARECGCLVTCENWFGTIGIVLMAAGFITFMFLFSNEFRDEKQESLIDLGLQRFFDAHYAWMDSIRQTKHEYVYALDSTINRRVVHLLHKCYLISMVTGNSACG